MSTPPPDRPGSGLAARLKADLDVRARQEAAASAHAEICALAARERVDRLMEDLTAFARSVGYFRVWSFWGTLYIRYQRQMVRLTPQQDTVLVRSRALRGHCRFEPQLERWIFQPDGRSRLILFDQGLSLIVEEALGVRPSEEV